MTREETKKILLILKTNYPQSFKNWDKERITMFIDLWTEAFKNDDVNQVIKAVKHIIYTDIREFVPNIAQVKNVMFESCSNFQVDVNQVWDLVLKNAKCDIQQATMNYKKLPANIQNVISPYFLSELGYSNKEQVGYKRTEFERKYKEVLERDKKLYLSGEISIQQLEDRSTKPMLETRGEMKSIQMLMKGEQKW